MPEPQTGADRHDPQLLRPLAYCGAGRPPRALCSSPAPAPAQEIKWRHDYHKAREEASQLGRPLVIDFGTQSCYWCKQLDIRTFNDPAVIALMNDHCVALKIDANQNTTLTEALRINAFPTLVFAGSDGRILGFQEGFVEAAA